MKKRRIILKLMILTLFLSPFFAKSQALSTIQKNSVRAPKNIIVDGKLEEWNNKLEAYNKTTGVYYTISNDQTNLYLTIQVIDYVRIKKILGGGITFTISNSTKKNDSTAIGFTFPVYDKGQESLSISDVSKAEPQKLDSIIYMYNQQIANNLRLIEIKGSKKISNGMISIYNENGIKSAAMFSKDGHYNYELSIPIKLIEGALTESSKFNYNLKLNGLKTMKGYAIQEVEGRPNLTFYVDNTGQKYFIGNMMSSPVDQELYYSTDFWGEYNLVK